MEFRPRYVSFILSAAILAMSGWMYAHGKQRQTELGTAVFPSRHPVSSEDLARSEKLKLTPAPAFQATDTFGTQIDFEKYRNGRPTVVVFILGGCPCSIEAQTLFNELQANYMDEVKFIGVSKGTKEQATQFIHEANVNFPVVYDDGAIAKLFDAKKSVYNALIGADGKIVKIYPGYCKEMASDLNDKLAQMIGANPKPVTLTQLPAVNTAGCDLFPEPVPAVGK